MGFDLGSSRLKDENDTYTDGLRLFDFKPIVLYLTIGWKK